MLENQKFIKIKCTECGELFVELLKGYYLSDGGFLKCEKCLTEYTVENKKLKLTRKVVA